MPDPTPSPAPASACHHPEPRANGPRGVGGADGIDDATLARWAEIAGRRWTTWTEGEVNDVVAAFPAMVSELRRLRVDVAWAMPAERLRIAGWLEGRAAAHEAASRDLPLPASQAQDRGHALAAERALREAAMELIRQGAELERLWAEPAGSLSPDPE